MAVSDRKIDGKRGHSVSPDVIRALRDGDENAYIKVYNSFVDPLKRFLICLIGSAEDGEELLQEVFIKIWESRENIDPEKNIKSYIFSIARNKALNFFRSNKGYELLDKDIDVAAGDYYVADQAMIARDTELLIEIAVESMPRQRKEVFRMYQNGMDYEQIAAKMDITVPNVRKYVMRARNDIKDVMAVMAFFLFTQ